jgi:hypothetical protein
MQRGWAAFFLLVIAVLLGLVTWCAEVATSAPNPL